MGDPIALNVQHLTKTYGTGANALTVLDDVSFSLAAGATCAVVGPSGSGKTTLLGLCAGLDRASSGSVSLDGVDLGRLDEDRRAQLRSEKVGTAASRVAPLAAVRGFLLSRQRQFRQAPGLVAEGRDMASVVFPDALLKIYLQASIEKRAGRRYKQLKKKGISANMASLIRDLAERDRRDSDRPLAPLKQAPEAEVLDTTALNIRETKDAAWCLVTGVWPELAAG